MPIKFQPNYLISSDTANNLMRIEVAKQQIAELPMTPAVLSGLRKTAKLLTTHYSTMIEGNRLNREEVQMVIEFERSFSGRARDEKEILGYYAALEQLEKRVAKGSKITERDVKALHPLVMSEGRSKVKP